MKHLIAFGLGGVGGLVHGVVIDFFKWRETPGPFDVKLALRRYLREFVVGALSTTGAFGAALSAGWIQ